MIDPKAVLSEHETYCIPTEGGDQCCLCSHAWPCEPHELATALQEAQAAVTREFDVGTSYYRRWEQAKAQLIEAQAVGVMAFEAGVEFATAARIMSRRAEAAVARVRELETALRTIEWYRDSTGRER